MGFLSKITKLAIHTAIAPVAIAADVLSSGLTQGLDKKGKLLTTKVWDELKKDVDDL